jgi:hypothetical protein
VGQVSDTLSRLAKERTVTETASRTLQGLIADPSATPQRIRDVLDGMSHGDRVAATRSLKRRLQIKLWERVDGFGELSLDDFVPRGTPAFRTVRHYGRNTLPAFVIFEKRFFENASGEVAGANFQRISPITGPGYFVAYEDPNKREVLIDYQRLPKETPEGWPRIRDNEHGLSRLIYGFMIDRVRRVSEHVTIGRASRHGKEFGAWFILCRETQP